MTESESDYEHAGEWTCEGCGETFNVDHKLDVLSHALACGTDTTVGDTGGHDGYRRRKQELEAVTA